MVRVCCVPNCKGNRNQEESVHIFKFPTCDTMVEKWICALPKEGFTVTKYSAVCHKHFKKSDIIWEEYVVDSKTGKEIIVPLLKPRLTPTAVPCIFSNYSSDSYRGSLLERKRNLSQVLCHNNEDSDVQVFNNDEDTDIHNSTSFNNLNELKDRLSIFSLPPEWITIQKKDSIIFMYLDTSVEQHRILYVLVNFDLKVTCFAKGVPLQLLFNNINTEHVTDTEDLKFIIERVDSIYRENEKFNKLVNKKNTAVELVNDILSTFDIDKKVLNFIVSQISLNTQHKNTRKYDADFTVFCSIFMLISPHAYNFVRSHGPFILPHPMTLKRLCSEVNCSPLLEQDPENFLHYIKQKIHTYENIDSHSVLMLDEIYVKPYMDYKGGNLVGVSSNDSTSLATSAHVFMIQSLLSDKKEVVHIAPVTKLTADDLFVIIKRVIIGLEHIGLMVLAVVTDNNSLNSKAMSQFSFPPKLSTQYLHPVAVVDRPLFFVFDFVHLLKCFRNNWINLKDSDLCFVYPNFNNFSRTETASFQSLRTMYEIEAPDVVKYSHGLSSKALWPTSIERQNVKLVLQIFNDKVVNGLENLGEKHSIKYWKGTAEFLKIIITWWNIVNVKTPTVGIRKNNEYQKPLTNKKDDVKVEFLQKFVVWLDHWKNITESGKLSTQTHTAAKHSTVGLLEITQYLIKEHKYSYVLPGKLQTDVLESRFGQYRQLAGSQYHVSVRQIFEIEKKIRLLSTLELPIHGEKKIVVSTVFDEDMPDNEYSPDANESQTYSVQDHDYCCVSMEAAMMKELCVTEADLNDLTSTAPLLTFIAGYCCYSLLKRLKCEECALFLVRNDIALNPEEICVHENTSSNAGEYCVIQSLSRGKLKYPTHIPVILVSYTYIIFKQLLKSRNEKKFLSLQNHRKFVTDITLKIAISQEYISETDCKRHSSMFLFRSIIWKFTNTLLNNYCQLKNVVNRDNARKVQTFSTHC